LKHIQQNLCSGITVIEVIVHGLRSIKTRRIKLWYIIRLAIGEDGRFTDPGAVIGYEGQFHMLRNRFAEFPGAVDIHYHTSDDGLTWEAASENPVIVPDDVPFDVDGVYASSVIIEDDDTWVLYLYAYPETPADPGEGGYIIRATADNPLKQVKSTGIATLQDKPQTAIHRGIGKTALAIEFAHRHYDEFPDGVLWISATAGDVLSMLMTAGFACGHDVSTLNDVEGRAAAIRSLLATKQALLIIDDVQTSDVLRYLVPGGDCAVLITTRQRNLSALAGMPQIELSPLTADSMTLFEQFLPVDVVAANRQTVEQLIEALGYLPLAVTLAASRIAYEPGWTIPQFWQVL
jgi:hypothetical protein